MILYIKNLEDDFFVIPFEDVQSLWCFMVRLIKLK